MYLRTALATLTLIAVPALASAEGCGWQHKNQSVSQCPAGQSYDMTTGSCVTLSTS
jgi:hypothetical protein